MDILKNIHFEWWQALIVVFVLGMTPIFKAIATILVARMVKPGIAKVALPLILAPKTTKAADKEKAAVGK